LPVGSQVEELVGAGREAAAHLGDVAQAHELALALLQNREEDVWGAQVFAAPLVADVAGGLDEGSVRFALLRRRAFLVRSAFQAFLQQFALRASGDAVDWGALALGDGFDGLEDLGAGDLLKGAS
jgi:hypothetical protein